MFVLAAFASATIGCSSTHQFLVQDRQQIQDPRRVYKIQTVDNKIISFESDSLGYAILRDTTLERSVGYGSVENIPLSTVKVLYARGPDQTRSVIAIALGVGVIVLIITSIDHGLHSGSW